MKHLDKVHTFPKKAGRKGTTTSQDFPELVEFYKAILERSNFMQLNEGNLEDLKVPPFPSFVAKTTSETNKAKMESQKDPLPGPAKGKVR